MLCVLRMVTFFFPTKRNCSWNVIISLSEEFRVGDLSMLSSKYPSESPSDVELVEIILWSSAALISCQQFFEM